MNDEIELAEYAKIVKRHWILACLSFIIVLGAIIAYTILSPKVYEAKSLIVITSQDQANFLLGSSAPKVTDIETQKIVIQGSDVMNPIYSIYKENTFTLNVNNVKNSNVIEISVQSSSPENSSTIANHIATNYINYVTTMRTQDAESSVQFITDKIKSYDDEISALNVKLLYYQDLGNSTSKDDRIAYQNVQRELTAKGKIYDYLLEKREEAALTASLKSTNVQIIEYASVPLTPIKPNVPLNVALGAILAIGAAFGSAMAAHYLSNNPKKK